MVSVSRNHRVTNSHLWGFFLFTVLYFKCGIKDNFRVWSEKTYFYLYVLSFLWWRHCRNIADYFSSFIFPVSIIVWPQNHGWGPNWSKICCVSKWPSQIKVNSVPNCFEQRHHIWSKYSEYCCWRAQYQLFHWNYLLLVLLTFEWQSMTPNPKIGISMFYGWTWFSSPNCP